MCNRDESIFFILEPTNNVAPKKIGAEFGGWRVLDVKSNGTAWLTCQVSGFPVPRFLYVIFFLFCHVNQNIIFLLFKKLKL